MKSLSIKNITNFFISRLKALVADPFLEDLPENGPADFEAPTRSEIINATIVITVFATAVGVLSQIPALVEQANIWVVPTVVVCIIGILALVIPMIAAFSVLLTYCMVKVLRSKKPLSHVIAVSILELPNAMVISIGGRLAVLLALVAGAWPAAMVFQLVQILPAYRTLVLSGVKKKVAMIAIGVLFLIGLCIGIYEAQHNLNRPLYASVHAGGSET